MNHSFRWTVIYSAVCACAVINCAACNRQSKLRRVRNKKNEVKEKYNLKKLKSESFLWELGHHVPCPDWPDLLCV